LTEHALAARKIDPTRVTLLCIERELDHELTRDKQAADDQQRTHVSHPQCAHFT
jgi:hypothetical protein